MNFALFGYGTIGQKIYKEELLPMVLNTRRHSEPFNVVVYKNYKRDDSYFRSLEEPNQTDNIFIIDPKLEGYKEAGQPSITFDIAFICVDTPGEDNDCSIIEDILSTTDSKIFVVKSTVLPKNAIESKSIIYSPEFTSATPYGGFKDFVILGGGSEENKQTLEKLYRYYFPADFKIIKTSAEAACITKYTINTFLAMKVTFFNEIAKICQQEEVDYEDVRSMVLNDKRINPSHTISFDYKPYYDSHCFNKDVPALAKAYNTPLISAIDLANQKLKG